MVAKWFLLLNKMINALRAKLTSAFEESGFVLHPKTLSCVIGLSLIAPFLVSLYSLFLLQQEALLEQKMEGLEKKIKSLVVFKHDQDRFIREFGACDLAFLQKYVERVPLLREEVDFLSKINADEDYAPIQERLSFLTTQNSLQFILRGERKSAIYQEKEWSLKKSVEVQNSDVLQLLSLLEGVNLPGFSQNPLRPQFIIKKFSLKAKEGIQDKGFYLDLEILQRSLCEKI